MNTLYRTRQLIVLIGDVFILYITLILTLWLRYDKYFYRELIDVHFQPLTIVFIIWTIIFYIAGLYDLRFLKNDFEFKKTYVTTLIVNILIGIVFFYILQQYFKITPRANLVIFFLIFSAINYLWRHLYNFTLTKTDPMNRLLLIGSNEAAKEIANTLENHPQLGYKIKFWMQEGLQDKEFKHISQIILANDINIIVIPAHLKKNQKAAKLIYQLMLLGIEVIDLTRLYELIFRKVPLSELEEVWFLENLVHKHRIYEFIMNPIERILAFIFIIVLSPLLLVISVIIKLTSHGPIIFKQDRMGKNEDIFTMYKFRTMPIDAERNGPQWADYHRDKRATWFGSILRKTHLDEFPQLLNIIKGELSFVGPRPERPTFVDQLKKELPYYDLRHLAKPGITGWAQINFRYAASSLDAFEKLQYDIYYIKNNSLLLDFLIILKTLKFIVTNHS